MIKKIFFIFWLLFFVGCANKEYIFVPTNSKCIKKTDIKIGIEKIELPYYMNDLEIMELKNNKLIPTNRYLSKEPDEIIITKLSNILCDPYVYYYPWEGNAKYKIIIKIDDFYFSDDKIYMNARIYINSKFKKIFFIQKCKNEYKCINKAFNVLTFAIIKEIG